MKEICGSLETEKFLRLGEEIEAGNRGRSKGVQSLEGCCDPVVLGAGGEIDGSIGRMRIAIRHQHAVLLIHMQGYLVVGQHSRALMFILLRAPFPALAGIAGGARARWCRREVTRVAAYKILRGSGHKPGDAPR